MSKRVEIVKKRTVIFGILAAIALASFVSAPAFAQPAMEFKIFCARCHGTDGGGDGPDGASLSTKPQDFKNCAEMAKLTDDTIFRAIKDGGAAVGKPADMPAWGQAFSDDQIKGLVKYVRTFCHK